MASNQVSSEEDEELYNDDDYDDDDYAYCCDDGDDQTLDDLDENPCLRNNGQSSSKVITRDSLLAAQKEDLQRIMDMMSLSEHHARTILIHYRWDVETALSVFVERGRDQLFAEAGVKIMERSDPCSSSSSTLYCAVCMGEKSAHEFTTMDCAHYFCNECWTEHFIVQISEGKSRRLRCMTHKCYSVCDEAVVRNLVGARDPELAEKFERYLLESYIDDNNKVKWCPSVPHCGNAIRVEDDKFCEVECACGQQFCFSCSCEAHSPCSCLMWQYWVRKCQEESETIQWMTVNTKPCPKCMKLVEKNGGCNHVACICGQSFCWICGGATGRSHSWASIEGHSCGRFKEDEVKNVERAKKTESKSKDFSWVTTALERLFRSRRILSYSYPFAYYRFGDELFENERKEAKEIKQNLFEDQQQQLEGNVERLSSWLEERFEEYNEQKLMDLRLRLMDLCSIIDNLCSQMYSWIENELLSPYSVHIIAPYKSKGLEKASEISDTISMGTQSSEYSLGHIVYRNDGITSDFLALGNVPEEMNHPLTHGLIFSVASDS
ncbi:putative E3 ubiquitin-protein ligase ARI1 [Drosera capensis]